MFSYVLHLLPMGFQLLLIPTCVVGTHSVLVRRGRIMAHAWRVSINRHSCPRAYVYVNAPALILQSVRYIIYMRIVHHTMRNGKGTRAYVPLYSLLFWISCNLREVRFIRIYCIFLMLSSRKSRQLKVIPYSLSLTYTIYFTESSLL